VLFSGLANATTAGILRLVREFEQKLTAEALRLSILSILFPANGTVTPRWLHIYFIRRKLMTFSKTAFTADPTPQLTVNLARLRPGKSVRFEISCLVSCRRTSQRSIEARFEPRLVHGIQRRGQKTQSGHVPLQWRAGRPWREISIESPIARDRHVAGVGSRIGAGGRSCAPRSGRTRIGAHRVDDGETCLPFSSKGYLTPSRWRATSRPWGDLGIRQ
jgi:hypothetical protein